MPEDIGPFTWVNKMAGITLLAVAVFPALPIGAAVYYDGFASILDWPAMFNWFAAFLVLFLGSGLYLLVTPQRVGGAIAFREGGFAIQLQNFVLKGLDHDVSWTEVIKIELAKAAQNPDGITITLSDNTILSFQTRYFACGGDEVLARLSASAEAAGYRLARQSGFNAVLVEKQTWHILPLRS